MTGTEYPLPSNISCDPEYLGSCCNCGAGLWTHMPRVTVDLDRAKLKVVLCGHADRNCAEEYAAKLEADAKHVRECRYGYEAVNDAG